MRGNYKVRTAVSVSAIPSCMVDTCRRSRSSFIFLASTIPLVGPDEPRYAQVAREMFERGDWITPTLGGFHWFEKPALLYWLEIVSYKVFGVIGIFGTARPGCYLGSALSVAYGYLENFPTSKARRRDENDFANWLALIAASTIGIIVFSRGASFDIIIHVSDHRGNGSFFIFDRASIKRSTRPAAELPAGIFILPYIFYFFIGVALLAKGLVGIVFPFAIVAFYYLLAWTSPGPAFYFQLILGNGCFACGMRRSGICRCTAKR